jgi:hypothetical protein
MEDDFSQGDELPQIIFGKVISPSGKILFKFKLPYKEEAISTQIPKKDNGYFIKLKFYRMIN